MTSLVYGEISFQSFINILDRARPLQGEVFFDLGHGTGRALCVAALQYGSILSKIGGIEIIPELFSESEKVVERLTNCMNSSENIFKDHNVSIEVKEFGFPASLPICFCLSIYLTTYRSPI